MSEEKKYETPMDFINVKRITEKKEVGNNKDQEQYMFCVGLNSDGTNELDRLLAVLEKYRGKQVNFDFRIHDKKTQEGRPYRGAFLMVKEMIPRGSDPRFQKKTDVKSKAEEIKKKFGKP
jgi:hypothetical protein